MSRPERSFWLPSRGQSLMTEIRLCWNPEIAPEREAECAGPWLPLTDENIEALEALVIDGADGYGEGTHWIERR
jgi:hypothetical protein